MAPDDDRHVPNGTDRQKACTYVVYTSHAGSYYLVYSGALDRSAADDLMHADTDQGEAAHREIDALDRAEGALEFPSSPADLHDDDDPSSASSDDACASVAQRADGANADFFRSTLHHAFTLGTMWVWSEHLCHLDSFAAVAMVAFALAEEREYILPTARSSLGLTDFTTLLSTLRDQDTRDTARSAWHRQRHPHEHGKHRDVMEHFNWLLMKGRDKKAQNAMHNLLGLTLQLTGAAVPLQLSRQCTCGVNNRTSRMTLQLQLGWYPHHDAPPTFTRMFVSPHENFHHWKSL